MESPESLHLRNQLRLAGEVDRIGFRSVQVLRAAANRIVRQLSVTGGPATSQALMAQLAQIQGILQEAGVQGYARFVDDLAESQATWSGRDQKEVKAEIESSIDQGLISQQAANAGPAVGQTVGQGLNAQQQALLSQQALRTASRMGPLELAVAGSKKQPYSLAREYARGFLQPDGRSTQTAYLNQVLELQNTFERSVRQAVVTGQTTQDLIKDLKGTDGGPSLIEPHLKRTEAIARTGAQSVANAIQRDTLESNPAVKYVRYTATLDRRTSPVCRSLDGEVYKKQDAPVPPLHFNCRSTLVAHIPGRDRGSRSMTMMVQGDDGKVRSFGAYDPTIQDKLSASQKSLLQQNKSGKPPSYQDWLKAQPASAQDVVLGRKNGKRFRANDGSLTRSLTPSAKRALAAQPKPLTKTQIKPLPKPKVDPRPGPDKVAPPPAKPAPPAGTKPDPKVPPQPSPPSPKPAKAKPAPKKAAPKPSPKPAPQASKPSPPSPSEADQKKITQLQKSLSFQEQQLAKATSDFTRKTLQQGIDKAKKELAALGGQQLQAASKTLVTAKPGSPEFKAATAQAKTAQAATAKASTSTLPKRQRGDKTSRVKSENQKVQQQGDRTVTDVKHKPTKKDLGYDWNQMDAFTGDVVYWGDLGYRRIRGAQLVKNKAKPRKGTPDWTIKDEYQNGYGAGEQREFDTSANNLEDFISRAPKYKGQVHRGILLPDDKAYDSFMEGLEGSKKVATLESWSADRKVASGFANGQKSGGSTTPGVEVMLHVENKHGAPIAAFARANESEVLMPSKVRYRVTKKEVFTDLDDPDFDPEKTGKRKRVEVYLEQIED